MIKRDFRYILKRVIIGFLIGMLLFICKNKIVFASTVTHNYSSFGGATISLKYHYQPCYNDNGTLLCGTLYPDGDYLPDIEISRLIDPTDSGNWCGMDPQTGLYTSTNKSFILSYVDFEVVTGQPIPVYNNNLFFPYFSVVLGSGDFINQSGNNIMTQGYFTMPIYSDDLKTNGMYSPMGSRPFYCSYYENNSFHSCLYESDYYTSFKIPNLVQKLNYYNLSPIINFTDGANHTINSIHFKYGYPEESFTISKSNFVDYFTGAYNRTLISNNYSPNNYPLAFYDTSTTNQVRLPVTRNSVLCTSFYSADNSNDIFALPESEFNPEYPGMSESELTPEQQEIVDSVNDIFSVFTPEFWGSLVGGNGLLDEIVGTGTSDITKPLGSFLGNSYSTGFIGLFESIFQTPLDLLEEQLEYDLWSEGVGYTDYNYCLGSRIDGSSIVNPKVVLWEYKTGNNSYNSYSVDIPCMTDLYSKINSPSGQYGFNSFYPIYRNVIDGLLIYYLLINILAFYKFVLDPKNSRVEVLEL